MVVLISPLQLLRISAVKRLCDCFRQLKQSELLRGKLDVETYRFVSMGAILIVDLYPASRCLKLLMPHHMYLDLAWCLKLTGALLHSDKHLIRSCLKPLQV
jgi:hypothetical protein